MGTSSGDGIGRSPVFADVPEGSTTSLGPALEEEEEDPPEEDEEEKYSECGGEAAAAPPPEEEEDPPEEDEVEDEEELVEDAAAAPPPGAGLGSPLRIRLLFASGSVVLASSACCSRFR